MQKTFAPKKSNSPLLETSPAAGGGSVKGKGKAPSAKGTSPGKRVSHAKFNFRNRPNWLSSFVDRPRGSTKHSAVGAHASPITNAQVPPTDGNQVGENAPAINNADEADQDEAPINEEEGEIHGGGINPRERNDENQRGNGEGDRRIGGAENLNLQDENEDEGERDAAVGG